MKFLALDTETGGIGPSVSLLTAHFIVFDIDGEVLDDLSLSIHPQEVDQLGNPIYKVCGQALSINKIDLIEHSRNSVSVSMAGTLLEDFLRLNAVNESTGYKQRLIPVGQSIAGDLEHLKRHFSFWDDYVSHIYQDTMHIGKTLQVLQMVDVMERLSLSNLTKLFNVPLEDAHTAKGDAVATMKVFLEEIKYLRGDTDEIS